MVMHVTDYHDQIGGRRRLLSRELKIETFSGRRRPDWQRKPGTEAAVASRQNSNIKIAVNSEGRRPGRISKRKIWLHTELREQIFAMQTTCIGWTVSRFVGKLWVQKSRFSLGQLLSVHAKKNMRDEAECKAEFCVEKKQWSPQACRSLANPRNIKMLPRYRILSLLLK